MQSQSRNWFIFFGCFFVLLLGHSWLRTKLWPPPEKPKPEAVDAARHVARIVGAVTGAGLRDAATVAAAAATTQQNAVEFAIAQAKAKAQAAAEAAAKPRPPEKVEARPEPIPFGGDDYLLKVKLTAMGAGVEELTLTQFHEADRLGLPVNNADGSPKLLNLIPRGPATAFAIYHYPLTTNGEEPERPLDTLGKRIWTVVEKSKGDADQSISFATELPDRGIRLVKTFTLRKRELHLGLTVRVERLAGSKVTAPFFYQLAGPSGLPLEGIWYSTQFRHTLVGQINDKGAFERTQEDVRALSHSGGSERFRRGSGVIQYAAVAVQYFTSAIVADDQTNNKFIEFVRSTVENQPDPKQPFLDDITVRTITESLDPKPGEPIEHKYLLYNGPVKIGLLNRLDGQVSPEAVAHYEHLHLATFTDYGKFGFWTEAIIYFTNLVHWLLSILRSVIPNNGICIILVTVIVRGLMFPVSRKQAATMARTQENMAKLQPEIKKIKEKFKGNVLEQQQAMSALYKKHGVNPAAGLGGCLMIFLQMPVFLGLYFAIQESFFFRLSPFLWIRNLAAPDMLFWWGESIPWISDPASMGGFFYLGPFFNLLPIIAIALMFVQQKMSMPPAMDEQTQMQQSMMKYMMIFFGFMFYKVPAGLSLYFICSSAWGLAERKLLPKKKTGESAPGKTALPDGKPGASGARARGKPKVDEPPGKLKAWWEKLLKEAAKK